MIYSSIDKNEFIYACKGNNRDYNLYQFNSSFELKSSLNYKYKVSLCGVLAITLIQSSNEENNLNLITTCRNTGLISDALNITIQHDIAPSQLPLIQIPVSSLEETENLEKGSAEEEDFYCSEEYLYQDVETKKCLKSCSSDDLRNKKCKLNFISNSNITNFIEYVGNLIRKENITTDTNIVLDGNNTIYQIISSNKMQENENTNISIMDLGECEKILLEEYNLSYLLL